MKAVLRAVTLFATAFGGLLRAADCSGFAVDLRPPALLPVEAPQGLTVDTSDGSLWIVSAISTTVLHLSSELEVLGSLEAPFTEFGRQQCGGIAYRPDTDTLLLSEPYLPEIKEVFKNGAPTGLGFALNLPSPPNLVPRPFVKGLEYDPSGDDGRGSIWLVESVMSALYEVSLEGQILTSLCMPDDPDGCPGKGLAALDNDVGLVATSGRVGGFELTTGETRRNVLLRANADGVYGGYRVSLARAGGSVGGFARGRARDPASGLERDVIFVSVESSAELHVMVETAPRLFAIEDLTCSVARGAVSLQWKGHGAYESVSVFRDGTQIATLPGAAEQYEDASPPDGVLSYSVRGSSGDCETESQCRAVVGAGEILRSVPFRGEWAVGIAEDSTGHLWVTDTKNQIFIFDKDLNEIVAFPGPFPEPTDELSAIAFHPSAETMFVYNWKTNEVAEINDLGETVSDRFPSGVTSSSEAKAVVTAMLFRAAGARGAGSFWYLDATSGLIEERDRLGVLLSSCVHPDERMEPAPPGSRFGSFAFGMCEVPGTDFTELHVSGGRARERATTRILTMDTGCNTLLEEIPAEGVSLTGPGGGLAILRTRHNGKDVLFALDSAPLRSRVLELEVRPPPVPFVRDLACRQPGPERTVSIRFTNPGGLETVEIRRDGALLASVPGDTTSYEDVEVPEGLRSYEVLGQRAGLRGDGRACEVQVGPGSLEARAFAGGVSFISSLALDPTDSSHVLTSSLHPFDSSLWRFDQDLKPLGSLPSPFSPPLLAAAATVRNAQGKPEIYCLGWQPGMAQREGLQLPLTGVNREGIVLRKLLVTPPKPRGGFVVYPAGLAWDSSTDTFWLLERNAFQIVQVSLEGQVLSSFAHPAVVPQDGVLNLGIAIDSSRNVLYLSSAGALDERITRIVEVTRTGQLTGFEVPVGGLGYGKIWGFAASGNGHELVLGANVNNVWDLVRVRAFDPVEPVRALTCQLDADGAALAWENPVSYDSMDVYRGTLRVASLEGTALSWHDPDAAEGPGFYRIVPRKGDFSAPGSVCEIDLASLFIRGDVEENGVINITDAVAILSYLFLGNAAPRCLDAADVDDTGLVNISDAISLLGYLFNSGDPPQGPFPLKGLDPTLDALPCGS